MDWINCNSCCRQPGDERDRIFKLSSCGHLFCDVCLAKGGEAAKSKCLACSAKCQLIQLSSKIKPDAEMFFLEPAELLKRQHIQVLRLLEFQKSHRVRLVSFHRKVISRYNDMEKQLKSSLSRVKELEEENLRLRQQHSRGPPAGGAGPRDGGHGVVHSHPPSVAMMVPHQQFAPQQQQAHQHSLHQQQHIEHALHQQQSTLQQQQRTLHQQQHAQHALHQQQHALQQQQHVQQQQHSLQQQQHALQQQQHAQQQQMKLSSCYNSMQHSDATPTHHHRHAPVQHRVQHAAPPKPQQCYLGAVTPREAPMKPPSAPPPGASLEGLQQPLWLQSPRMRPQQSPSISPGRLTLLKTSRGQVIPSRTALHGPGLREMEQRHGHAHTQRTPSPRRSLSSPMEYLQLSGSSAASTPLLRTLRPAGSIGNLHSVFTPKTVRSLLVSPNDAFVNQSAHGKI